MSDPYVSGLSHPSTPCAKPAEITKVLATINPEQITPVSIPYKSLNLTGKKGNNSDNVGSVYVGFNSTNQPFEIAPGSTINIQADRDGWPHQMNKLWLRGAVGDGIVGDYFTELDS